MKAWLIISVWLVMALLLYLFIREAGKEANKLNAENHKPQSPYKIKVIR